jgi:hypothetical protein
MTKQPSKKITISSRHGVKIRHGWIDLDGLPAMIILVIIVTVRMLWKILVITDKVTAWLCWRAIGAARIVSPVIVRAARWLVRQSHGLVLCFRAFYTE